MPALAIAEAMAAGTPVVATLTEGAREVVDRETGLLVPIDDVAKIAEAIANLLTHDDRRRAMAHRARKVVNEKFSLQRMVDQIEQIYRD